ncbi:hypothetical protein HanIR_Chr17g0878001 [Helianthus annuus]|nr:hypothetical protein HanIR_Chr17g0878001 [Helianthus annuus]
MIAFKHQFAYNLPESALKLEIGIESNCKINKHHCTYNNTKTHIITPKHNVLLITDIVLHYTMITKHSCHRSLEFLVISR